MCGYPEYNFTYPEIYTPINLTLKISNSHDVRYIKLHIFRTINYTRYIVFDNVYSYVIVIYIQNVLWHLESICKRLYP